jgi:hypothetical protein
VSHKGKKITISTQMTQTTQTTQLLLQLTKAVVHNIEIDILL